jgi:opacity protein-like surface antigen
MFRLALLVGIVLGLAISTANDVAAQRSGFIIGIGAGPGFTTGDVSSKVGVATDFKIGAMLGESLQLYYAAKSNLLFLDRGVEATGVSGLGASYVLPSGFNINGVTGLATWWDFDGGTSNGFGFGAGVGYEFTDKWVFNLGGTLGIFEGDKVFNIAATLSFLSH